MTNYNGVRSVLKGLALKPSVHPYRLVIASEGVAVAWQSPGREDLLSYTTTQILDCEDSGSHEKTAHNFLRRLTCPGLCYTLLIRTPQILARFIAVSLNSNGTQLFAPVYLPEFAIYFVDTNNPNTCPFYYDTSAIETVRNFLRQPTCPQGLPALDKRCELGYNNG